MIDAIGPETIVKINPATSKMGSVVYIIEIKITIRHFNENIKSHLL